jgi:hypothetical protein
MRTKQAQLAQALSGRVRDHHRFLIQTHLAHLEFLDAHLKPFDQQIEQLIEQQSVALEAPSQLAVESTSSGSPRLSISWQQAMTLLDTIPGVARALRRVAACRSGYRYGALQECSSLV